MDSAQQFVTVEKKGPLSGAKFLGNKIKLNSKYILLSGEAADQLSPETRANGARAAKLVVQVDSEHKLIKLVPATVETPNAFTASSGPQGKGAISCYSTSVMRALDGFERGEYVHVGDGVYAQFGQ